MWRKGVRMLEALEPDRWERDALLWTSRRLRGVSGALAAVLYLSGLFWVSLAALLVALYFPAARIVLLFVTAAVAFVLGVFLWVMGARVAGRMTRRAERLEAMAAMSNLERHAHVARRMKERRSRPEPS